MALKNKMRVAAGPYLRPGEHVHAVIGAQTHSNYLALLTGFWMLLLLNRYRMIVATSHRLLVLDTGRFGLTKVRDVVTELPRDTRLGPARGVAWYRVRVGKETLRVHRRFFKDIEQSDLDLVAS
jgi:hypothetical protein